MLAAPLAAQTEVEPGLMQLNVKSASVQEVLKLIAEAGDFNIAIGGGVKGSVTLFVDQMAPRELLEVVIGVIDAAYVEENGAVWVMTKSNYESRYGEKFVDNLESRTFVLKQARVKDVLPSVKALLGDHAVVKPDLARNLLIVKASPRQVREAAQMLAVIDQPAVTRAYQLHSMPAELAAGLLGKMVTEETSIVEDRINQRLVVSSSEFELDRIGNILGMMDAGEGIASAVLDIQYARPDSLAAALRPYLTPEVGVIYADGRASKLVVADFPPVIESITQLAAEFDMPLRQVLVEAKILQVMTNREVSSGIDWSAIQDQINVSGNFPVLATDSPGVRGDFGNLSSQNYQVVVEALETFGETNLLSSPRLLVIDGGKGLIHVGSQVPYTTIDTRETAAGTINQFEKVVVVDVGVKLEVEVKIQGDDMIHMLVRPEVSSVTGSVKDIPIVDAATVDSALMVQSGNTVILGGLIKDETRKTRKGIPILASIPIIKYLFSSNVDQELKSELVILLTPRIMTGREAFVEGSELIYD